MTTDFRYRAWSRSSGEEVSGQVRASSQAEVRSILDGTELLVLDVDPIRRPSLVSRDMRVRRMKVKVGDVAWLARQLATTERAGLPIKRALETIAGQTADTAMGPVVADICRRLDAGEDLPAAFGAHRTELGAVSIALVAAGSAGGATADAFERLAKMTEARMALRRKVRSAITYPAVVLGIALLMTLGMLVFIVPTFRGMYASLGGTLPLPTRVLLSLSGLVRRTVWIVPLLVVFTIFAYRSWRSRPQNAVTIDRAKVRAPLVGALVYKGAVARVAGTLAGLLGAGVTTLVALELAGDAAGLRHITASLRSVGTEVRNGRSLTAALAAEGTWPDVMVQLTQVGEETGQVAELLTRYSEISEAEVSAEVERMVDLIEPILVVLIGGIVGACVICLYLPLFGIYNLLK